MAELSVEPFAGHPAAEVDYLRDRVKSLEEELRTTRRWFNPPTKREKWTDRFILAGSLVLATSPGWVMVMLLVTR
jgi:hypothetical protein